MFFKQDVYFAWHKDTGSGYLRGMQISSYLRDNLGYRNVYDIQLLRKPRRRMRKCIIFLVKYMELIKTTYYAERNNTLVFDCVDDHSVWHMNNPYIKHIIVSSQRYVDEYKKQEEYPYTDIKPGKLFYHIRHHWDTRLKKTSCATDKFSLAYIGHPEGCMYLSELPCQTISVVRPNSRWIRSIQPYSFHISIRPKTSRFKHKPFTKGATAAAVGACIIVDNKDLGALEALPNDYPYFTKDKTLESVLATIDYARSTFNQEPHKYALECMYKLRQETRINVIAEQYAKFIKSICV